MQRELLKKLAFRFNAGDFTMPIPFGQKLPIRYESSIEFVDFLTDDEFIEHMIKCGALKVTYGKGFPIPIEVIDDSGVVWKLVKYFDQEI